MAKKKPTPEKISKEMFAAVEKIAKKYDVYPGVIGVTVCGHEEGDDKGTVTSLGGVITPDGANIRQIKTFVKSLKAIVSDAEERIEDEDDDDDDDDDLDEYLDEEEDDLDDDEEEEINELQKVLMDVLVKLTKISKKVEAGTVTKKDKQKIHGEIVVAYEAAKEMQRKERASMPPAARKRGDAVIKELKNLIEQHTKEIV